MDFISNCLISPNTALCVVSDWVVAGCHSCGNKKQWQLVVFGQRSWRVFNAAVCDDTHTLCLEPLTDVLHCTDWILDVRWLTSDGHDLKLAIATAHNAIEVWRGSRTSTSTSTSTPSSSSTAGFLCCRKSQCSTVCILYSCLLSGNDEDTLTVYGGTVFNQVLVWHPFTSQSGDTCAEVQHRLCGHEGVIFSIALNGDGTMACTASDDRTVRLWNLASADGSSMSSECLHVLYGHSARIWKAIFVQEFIVSVGEDALVCIWDFNGHLLKEIKGHRGLNVWSVCDAHTTIPSIVTGGGDGGIRWWSLADVTTTVSQQFCLPVPGLPHTDELAVVGSSSSSNNNSKTTDFVRDVAVADSDHILLLMNSGCLLLYHISEKCLKLLAREPAFSSYSVMSLDSASGLVALGGLGGHMNVIKWDSAIQSGCVLAHGGKVFSVSWATLPHSTADTGSLFSVGPEGSMKWWKVVSSTAQSELQCQLVTEFTLPVCKHRWLSAVTVIQAQHLEDAERTATQPPAAVNSGAVLVVAGDRKGSLHTYRYSPSSPTLAKDPVTSLPGIHGKNGVTDLLFRRGRLQSCGRDGHVRELTLTQAGVLAVSSDRKFLPGVDWLEKFVCTSDGRRLLIGFHATHLLVWDARHAESVVTVPCGGGHRAWHFSVSGDGKAITFSFLQSNRLHYCTVDISEWSRQRVLQSSFHGREITCLAQVSSYDASGCSLLATGSEDCSVRLSLCDRNGRGLVAVDHAPCVHISGVRTLSCTPLARRQWVLLSGGGRSQIKAWLVTRSDDDVAAESCTASSAEPTAHAATATAEERCAAVSVRPLGQYPAPLSQRERRVRRQQASTSSSAAAESRVMSLSSASVADVAAALGVHLEGELRDACTEGVFVWAVYSDGWLRLFYLDASEQDLVLFSESEQQDRSLLCAEVVRARSESSVLVATAGGSGDVTLWDCSHVIRSYLQELVHRSQCPPEDCAASEASMALPKPVVVATLPSQPCTVTCLLAEHLTGGDVLLLSGGDGGSLALHCVAVSNAPAEGLSVREKWTASRPDCHGSTVTGICWLSSGHVVSTSCDQHIAVWKLSDGEAGLPLDRDQPARSDKLEEECQRRTIDAVTNFMCDIADCHAMVHWKERDAAGGSTVLALAGAGLQCLEYRQP